MRRRFSAVLPPTAWKFEAKLDDQSQFFSRMRIRARSIRQHEYVFLKSV
jgi:hypothetical protein